MNAWQGFSVVVLASGPSLTPDHVQLVKDWRQTSENSRVVAINTTHRLAPWADVLYACDGRWWRQHFYEVQKTFKGQRWTQDLEASIAFALSRVISRPGAGLCRSPGVVHQGGGKQGAGNSGYQVVNLLYQWGVHRIVLLGYDMRAHGTRAHWHPPHPTPVAQSFATWIAAFRELAPELAVEGVEVVNATPGSALDCFAKMSLEESLRACSVSAA